MGRKAKEDAAKRTFRLDNEIMRRVEQVAQRDKRTLTAQIEVLLSEALVKHETKQKGV